MPAWKSLHFLPLLALLACGCAGAGEKSDSDEVKAFFAAANEANFLGVACLSPQHVDLSAYTPLMGVKYPLTESVEVLSGPPSRPYQAFAVLQANRASASPSSQAIAPAVLAQLIAKARTIGADAIIICPPPTAEAAKVEAVAIKYRLENSEDKKRRP
jgi:hypothetical protein